MRKRFFTDVVCLSLALLWFVGGCSQNTQRKIKLSGEESSDSTEIQTVSSEIRILPEQQNSIAVFYFQNGTKDTSLNWLQRGLTDMLISELSQSPYLNVVPVQHLINISQKSGYQTNDLYDISVASRIADKANVETFITGRFYNYEDSLKIDATLWNMNSKSPLREETVSGAGLEKIFRMVNNLSERMRTNLRGKLTEVKNQARGKNLKVLTNSIEAFRCFSLALENIDKFLQPEAIECLEKAVRLDSNFAEAYLRMAMLKNEIGDYKGFVVALQEAKNDAGNLSKIGQIQLKRLSGESDKDSEKFLAVLEELLNYSPYDIEIRYQFANLLMGLKRYDRALEEYEHILDLDPGKKLAYNQIGYLYAYRGDFTNALKYLQEYHRLVPDEPNPHDSMGEILLMAGRFTEAEEQLKIALEKQPDFYLSAMRLVTVYSELGDLNKALEYSDYLLKKAPNPAVKYSAYLERAILLWRYDRIAEAKKTIELAEKLQPNSVLLTRILGEIYNSVGDKESANKVHLTFFEKNKKNLLNKKQETTKKRHLIFTFLEMNISPEKLIPIVNSLYENETDNFFKSDYRQLIGLLHLRQKEYKKAQKYFDLMDDRFVDLIMEIPRIGWNGWKYVFEIINLTPESYLTGNDFLDDIIKKAKKVHRQDIEILSRFSKALTLEKSGSEQLLMAEYQRLGSSLEDNWRVLGPFKNHNGFVKSFVREESAALNSLGNYGPGISWQSGSDGVHDGYVNLRSIFDRSSWAVGYGLVYLKSPEKRVVQIRLSTNESCKLWFNDEQVWQSYHNGSESPLDNDIVSVVLHQGFNKLLLKVTNSFGDWGYSLRITDEKGNGFLDLEFVPAEKVEETISMPE